MKIKENIGKVCKIRLVNRREPIEGYISLAGERWTLLKYIPVDYVIDGYLLVNNSKIIELIFSGKEEFKQKVISTKGIILGEYLKVNLDKSKNLFKDLLENFRLVQIDSIEEDKVYIGRITKVNSNNVQIRNLSPKGKWLSIDIFNYEDIWSVSINNDYLNSLSNYELHLNCKKK